MLWGLVVFFFKQKTAYEIGTGDWSSDVCSSDLNEIEAAETSTTIQPVINVTLCGGKRDEISYPKAIWKSFNTPFIKCAHYAVSANFSKQSNL